MGGRPRGAGRGGYNPRGGGRGRGGDRGGRGGGWGRAHQQLTPRFVAPPPPAFTLQDEVQNTGHRDRNFWDSDTRLRHSRINFVSAGTWQPSKLIENEPEPQPETSQPPKLIDDGAEPLPETAAMASMSLEDPGIDGSTQKKPSDSRVSHMKGTPAKVLAAEAPPISTAQPASNQLPEADPFVIDVEPGPAPPTKFPPPKVRSPSPSPSSSDEEILYKGRKRGLWIPKTESAAKTITKIWAATRPKPQAEARDPWAAAKNAQGKIVSLKKTKEEEYVSLSEKSSKDNSQKGRNGKPRFADLRSGRSRGRSREFEDDDKELESELIADYLANIAGDLDNSALRQRDLGGTDDEVWVESKDISKSPPTSKAAAGSGRNRFELDDIDDMSTDDGIRGVVESVVSKRLRRGDPQYLVVWEGDNIEDAKWVPVASFWGDEVSKARIAEFEKEEAGVREYVDDEDDDEESDTSDDGMSDSDLAPPSDGDIAKDISDEQLARLLAKQEELGMGSGELLMADADAFEDDGEMDSDAVLKQALKNYTPKRPGKAQNGSSRSKKEFPSASALADAYDGFDVMDFERPSLKKKPKGRRGKLPFDVDDPELDASMAAAYENDRIKKKERKQEREELRAQGLLGAKNGKPDLSAKYSEGMSFDAIKEEIREFLMSSHTTLALTPMDKKDRKLVHEFAMAFNLKSKSVGSGKQRFPILTRTSRTFPYTESAFVAAESRLGRRFLPRPDVKGKGKAGGGRPRVGMGATNYRDGDVVGGSAPELGAENKGRAMLEKMGWSSGTGLGALNNKGILQPVVHVVKTSKAGLG